MRSIWKGAVSFGLVTIPVRLYSATEERDVAFHQVHRSDGGRIRYKRFCQVCGEEVSYADIAKGWESPAGEVVVLTDDDLADLPLPTSKAVEVLQFVPLEQVDPLYFSRSYYLEPEAPGVKPYVLLREALERSGKVALVRVALRSREQLAALRVRDGVFVMETMLWPDEVRAPEFGFLDDEVEVRPQELAMAESLIETLAGDFDPAEHHDRYREALESVIAAKLEGREVVVPEGTEAPAQVVDLMAALRASVEQARAARGEAPAAAEEPPARRRPSRATAAKADKSGSTGPTGSAKAAGRGRAARGTEARAGEAPATKTPATNSPAAKSRAATSRAGAAGAADGQPSEAAAPPRRRTRASV